MSEIIRTIAAETYGEWTYRVVEILSAGGRQFAFEWGTDLSPEQVGEFTSPTAENGAEEHGSAMSALAAMARCGDAMVHDEIVIAVIRSAERITGFDIREQDASLLPDGMGTRVWVATRRNPDGGREYGATGVSPADLLEKLDAVVVSDA